MNQSCPICRSDRSEPVYAARRQPLLLNHLLESAAKARRAACADLDFRGCGECGFVWNAAFDPKSLHYGPGYVNDQSQSGVFREHLDAVMSRLRDLALISPGAILEIGCGQGTFLRSLCERTGRPGIGFDPALTGASQMAAGIEFRGEPFTASAAASISEPIGLIFCRHVLEHLADPAAMLDCIATVARRNPRAMLYLEVPTFDWIASHAAFFDFFNEHCSLFNVDSMQRLLSQAGWEPVVIEPVFDGQYLAIEARASQTRRGADPACARVHEFKQIAADLIGARERWSRNLEALAAPGPLVIWGAAAKGVSFVNQMNLGDDRVVFVIDINPAKWGKYVPLTCQRVISPQELPALVALKGTRPTALVMNPNYATEIAHQLRALGVNAAIEVVDGTTLGLRESPSSRPALATSGTRHPHP